MAGAWLCRRRELALLEPVDQGIERPVEHHGHVRGGDLVAQQRLGVAQLVVRGLADRHLQGEALGRQRFHPRTIACLPRGGRLHPRWRG